MIWCVATSQPGRDFYARDELRRAAFAVMLPTYSKRFLKQGRIEHAEQPLMRGYLFVGFDTWASDDWKRIGNTRGVKRVIRPQASERPYTMTDSAAAVIAEQCANPMSEPQAEDFLDKLVRVTSGPFASWVGGCVALEKRAAIVMLSLFGQPRPIRIPLEHIELAGDP